MLKEAAHPAYELCRSLKLLDEAGTLGHNEAEPEIPFRTQLIVGLLLRVPAAYAGLTMGLAYIFRGLIQLDIILITQESGNTTNTTFKQCVDLDERCSPYTGIAPASWCGGFGDENFTPSDMCCNCGGGQFLDTYICGTGWDFGWTDDVWPIAFALPYFLTVYLFLRDLASSTPRVQIYAALLSSFLCVWAGFFFEYWIGVANRCEAEGAMMRPEDERNRFEYFIVSCLAGTASGGLIAIALVVVMILL